MRATEFINEELTVDQKNKLFKDLGNKYDANIHNNIFKGQSRIQDQDEDVREYAADNLSQAQKSAKKSRKVAEDLTEIMAATSVPWKWTYRSERQATAEFTVGNVEYEFKAKNSEYDHVDADRDVVGYDDDEETEEVDYSGYWEISFKGNGKTSMTGTGNAAQVISAVTAILKDFITTYNNKIRVIEYDVQGSSGRAGVYGRIFSKLLPTWTQEDGSLHDVEIRRPEL